MDRCPGCSVAQVEDAEHLIDCPYQGRNALPLPRLKVYDMEPRIVRKCGGCGRRRMTTRVSHSPNTSTPYCNDCLARV